MYYTATDVRRPEPHYAPPPVQPTSMSTATEIPQHVLDKLDPEYKAFILSIGTTVPPPLNKFSWSAALRQAGPTTDSGSSEPIDVGSKRTIQRGGYSAKVMIPPGEKPGRGWPVVLYAHRGGWVFGNAEAEDNMLSRLCVEAVCVIVSVDYRLAPEYPFPAGLDDVWDALVWLSKEGEHEIGIDPRRVAVMGGSAGGNLAAAVAQRASLASPPIPLVYQALITPVINTSFSANDRSQWTPSMIEHEDNWDLTVLEMLWCRDLYLPRVEDRQRPDASPCFQEEKLAFEGMPATWISVAEVDTLRSEAEMYAEKLRAHRVPVTLKVLRGLTHTGIKSDRVCESVRKHHEELAADLRKAFS
ncbi:lipase, putative [Rhizoctonia solani AG-1 IB]|uniref:Lipase, putative n=1 Tax=Thanatephorus cucumeris (strain AG1-IB / isolate 7/3/14) TaxID=1108050 RepID=M5CBS3_THACB|nr:lipase, putative [Rhizoctonia solani AG-1 IB]CEL55078.1 lipase, putative [Rhizoctonia solani AG-1 IB]